MADEGGADAGPSPDLRTLVHDLRSPLAVVEGFASLLTREGLTDDQRADYARRITEAAGEMRAVIDRV